MSGIDIAETQPESFAFSSENEAKADAIIAKYPEGRQASAVMPLLDLAQRQHDNWIPLAAIDVISEKLKIPRIRVLEVATFYTMYNLKPVGKYFLQACTTTPCWLRGSDQVMKCIRDKLGIDNHQTTADGMFTQLEVECLGACANAPILQVNDDFYEDADYESTATLLDALKKGEVPPLGSLSGRNVSEPEKGAQTLLSYKDTEGARSYDSKISAGETGEK